MGDFTSGLVKSALALQSGQMSAFRIAVRKVINKKLCIYHGMPPVDATTTRDFLFNLFFKTCSTVTDKQKEDMKTFKQLINGDPGSSELQHYCSRCCTSKEDTREKLVTCIMSLICKSPPRLFAKHKWIGANQAIDWFGRLQTLNLLNPSFEILWGKKNMDEDGHECEQPEDLQQLTALSQLFQTGSGGQGNGEEEADFKIICKRWRSMALAWSRRSALFDEMIFSRLATEETYNMMQRELALSAAAWDAKQNASQLKNGHRKYRATEAYLDQSACMAFKEFAKLLQLDLTLCLPMEVCNQASMVLCFRLIARAAASVHHYVITKHSKFPYQLFGLLTGTAEQKEHLAKQIWDLYCTGSCVMDDGTKWFLGLRHLNLQVADDLLKPASLAILQAVASEAQTSIAQVECHHAANRRRLQSRVQTHSPTLAQASALYVSQSLRLNAEKPFAEWKDAPEPIAIGKIRGKFGPKSKKNICSIFQAQEERKAFSPRRWSMDSIFE